MDNEPSSSTDDKTQLPSKDVEFESSDLPSTSQKLDQRSSNLKIIKSSHDPPGFHFEHLRLDPFEKDLMLVRSGE